MIGEPSRPSCGCGRTGADHGHWVPDSVLLSIGGDYISKQKLGRPKQVFDKRAKEHPQGYGNVSFPSGEHPVCELAPSA